MYLFLAVLIIFGVPWFIFWSSISTESRYPPSEASTTLLVILQSLPVHDIFLLKAPKVAFALALTACYTSNLSIPCRLRKYCFILTAELAAVLVLEHLTSFLQLYPSLIFSDSRLQLLLCFLNETSWRTIFKYPFSKKKSLVHRRHNPSA